MEDRRETEPPFFNFVKRYISTQTHDKTQSFWGLKTRNTKRTIFLSIRSLFHHAKSLHPLPVL